MNTSILCALCKKEIHPDRLEAIPETELCIDHAREAEGLGGEFVLTSSMEKISKSGSLKQNYGGVTATRWKNVTAMTLLFKKHGKSYEGQDEEQAESIEPCAEDKNGSALEKAPVRAKRAPLAGRQRDVFGCLEGSQAWLINSAILDIAITLKAVVEKTGLSRARVASHIKWLLGKNYILETEQGYMRCAPSSV